LNDSILEVGLLDIFNTDTAENNEKIGALDATFFYAYVGLGYKTRFTLYFDVLHAVATFIVRNIDNKHWYYDYLLSKIFIFMIICRVLYIVLKIGSETEAQIVCIDNKKCYDEEKMIADADIICRCFFKWKYHLTICV